MGSKTKVGLGVLGVTGIGAALMYLLDPQRGKRRRAVTFNKARSLINHTAGVLDAASRDLYHRSSGYFSEMRGRMQTGEIDDAKLTQRVRSRLGRVVTHPHPVRVSAIGGHIVLSGPVLQSELNSLLRAVRSTRGVQSVENKLDIFRNPADHPSLRTSGSQAPRSRQTSYLTRSTPGGSLLSGILGGSLLAFGSTQAPRAKSILTLTGLAAIARSLFGIEGRYSYGAAGRRTVDIHKTIDIQAPVETVWEFWSHCENIPRFMTHVKSVSDAGDGRTRWVARGPLGKDVEWFARTTRFEPNHILSWRSEAGAPLQSSGQIHFSPTRSGGTHVELTWSYTPPAGSVSSASSQAFSDELEHNLDKDLGRLKSLLEDGKIQQSARQSATEEFDTSKF